MGRRQSKGTMQIDTGVRLPVRKTHLKYPLKELKVGESFLAPVSSTNISGSIYLAKIRTGFKYSVRKEGAGCRVWRIA